MGLCGLVLCVACVALYACGVRRIKGLWRVCPSFCLFDQLFCPLSFPLFPSCCSLCVFVALSLLLLFPLRTIRKKKRAQFSCVLSCPVVGLLCKIGFSVLVKLVIIALNVIFYAFVGVGVFIIVPPLLKKTFENTLNKIPRVKFVLYALLYVV